MLWFIRLNKLPRVRDALRAVGKLRRRHRQPIVARFFGGAVSIVFRLR